MRRRTAMSWLLEISLAAVAMLFGLFFVHESIADGDGAPIAVEILAGVLTFVGLVLFRRTHPVALTMVLIPAGICLGMPMGATPIALFAVGLHRPARFAVTLTALHATAVAVVYWLVLGFTSLYVETVAFLVLVHLSLVAVAMLVRSQRQLVASWAERARQAEEGQRLRVEQARLAERERIAREMHDVLAHRISLLAVHAGALEVRRGAQPAEQQAAGVIRECAHDALEDLRSVIGMLRAPVENEHDSAPEDNADGQPLGRHQDRPQGQTRDRPQDRPQPTLGDVPALVEQSRVAGAEVGLSLGGHDGVPDQVGRHAYRIVQEALTNARKHAPGAPVRVEISRTAERGLIVRVDNALAPGSALPGAGAGLVGLRERVQLVGGRLEHGPTPAGEFHLKAWLPWQV